MLALPEGWPAARHRLPRLGLSAALVLVLAAAATACGSGDDSGGSAKKSDVSAGVKEAEAAYKAKMGAATWKAPGPAFDASKAAGKTVSYIGVDMSIPILQTISGELKQALARVGAKLDICDGKGQP